MTPLANILVTSDDRQAALLDHFWLRLYVTEFAMNSIRAIANVRRFCEEYLAGRHDLEIVDLALCPASTVENQIIATPTLIKLSPLPRRRFIGDMSRIDRIALGLGLPPTPAILSQNFRL